MNWKGQAHSGGKGVMLDQNVEEHVYRWRSTIVYGNFVADTLLSHRRGRS